MDDTASLQGTLRLPWSLRVLRRIPFPKKLGLLERLYGATLARHGIKWVHTAPGPLWKLDLSDACHRWIIYGDYEGTAQMRWVRRWLRNGDVVVDSGANIGQMLLYFASTAAIRILAFEPLPNARDWLLECLAQQSDWNVSVFQYGLGDSSTVVTLQVQGALSTSRQDWYSAKALDRIEIAVEPLDSVLAQQDVQRVRLWKLDVEGGECAAIRGGRDSLRTRRIEAVLVESTRDSFPELLTAFQRVGFGLFDIRRDGSLRAASGSGVGNVVALPEECQTTGGSAT
jgi:FkbM family methyltransferase